MIIDLGLIDYEDAYRVQKEFVVRRRLAEIGDTLIVAEHKPVFTIGRAGSKANLLADEKFLNKSGIKVLDTDRGGDITFHGPGQLVAYPVIDLKVRGRDLHRYLRDLEEVAISFLGRYSVSGQRRDGSTGVWVGDRKIASIGVGASDWVTYHGLSVNVNADLNFFSMIYPCGMKDVKATSLNHVLGRKVSMDDAREKLLSCLCKVFCIGEASIADSVPQAAS